MYRLFLMNKLNRNNFIKDINEGSQFKDKGDKFVVFIEGKAMPEMNGQSIYGLYFSDDKEKIAFLELVQRIQGKEETKENPEGEKSEDEE